MFQDQVHDSVHAQMHTKKMPNSQTRATAKQLSRSQRDMRARDVEVASAATSA